MKSQLKETDRNALTGRCLLETEVTWINEYFSKMHMCSKNSYACDSQFWEKSICRQATIGQSSGNKRSVRESFLSSICDYVISFFFSTCVICYKSHLAIDRNYRSVPADTLEKYIGLLLDLILTKIVDSCVAWTRFTQRWSIGQLLPQITINGRSWPDYKKVKTPRLSLIVAFKTGHLVLFLMRVT